MTWFAGRGGRRVELLHPVPEQVDFVEIAWSLAGINRYGGHAETPISVGQHTLIVFEAAPPALKAHALLHDAHEARINDITSPMKRTMRALAEELYGEAGAEMMKACLETVALRHDAAIHTAAGVLLPNRVEHINLKRLDLAALATERRDFFGVGHTAPAWVEFLPADIEPLPRVHRFMPRDRVASALLAAFNQWLPALRKRAA